jgi:hypothetical protein
MSNDKHTPGPWTINANKINGNGYHIVTVNSSATSEGIANARLIASAPELLEALIQARAEAKLVIDMVNAAIARAEGGAE